MSGDDARRGERGDVSTVTVTGKASVNVGVRSFEDFYAHEQRDLYRALAFSLGDAALAAEAVDEAMARAYARWRKVGAYDNPAGWVYRVALNWARNRFRSRRRISDAGVPDVGRHDPEPVDPALWRAVASLPVAQRDVVVLRFQLDWSLERIASSLEIPVGTVKSRLNRGLERLRNDLEVTP